MRGFAAGEGMRGADAGAELVAPRRNARARSWWLLLNLLALDAPLVAVVWLHAFAATFSTPVGWPETVALFLAVWSIYLADRLIDARCQVDQSRATARHDFARRHGRLLALLLTSSLSAGAYLALTHLDAGLLRAAAILAAAVALYFGGFVRLFRGWRPLPAKEVVCGVVFAAGCAVGVDGVRQAPLSALPVVMLFGALCAFNCLAISAWEKACDRVNDTAAASRWWRRLDLDLLWLGLGLAFLSYVGFRETGGERIYLAMFLSCVALNGLHLARRTPWLSTARLRRVLADAVLLTPLLVV